MLLNIINLLYIIVICRIFCILRPSTSFIHTLGYLKDRDEILKYNSDKLTEIKENINKIEEVNDNNCLNFIKKLSNLSNLYYNSDSIINSTFKPPNDLKNLKLFTLNENESHFIFKMPLLAEYRLITGCMSLLYLSIYVDDYNIIYLDGISDSIIIRGVVAILLSLLNNKTLNEVSNFDFNDYKIFNKILNFNLIKKSTLESIISQIKDCKFTPTKSLPADKRHKKRFDSLNLNIHSYSVAVLVSGGVDSSVALWMLKQRGYHVEAFHLKINNIIDQYEPCDGTKDIEYVSNVCDKLGVRLHVIPFSGIYRDNIIKDLINGYKMGEVPNPDMECNNKIKFGHFLRYALDWGFDYVSSGHYARLSDDYISKDDVKDAVIMSGCNYDNRGFYKFKRLLSSIDTNKDQTYFLSNLKQSQLIKIIFPIGHFKKDQIRDIAYILDLCTHNRKDSVGLCFLGNVNLSSYLRESIGIIKGPIVDHETGEVIGEHDGIYNYTIGQRIRINEFIYKSFNNNLRRHVIDKDVHKNIIYVTTKYNSHNNLNNSIRTEFNATNINWIIPDYKKLLSSINHNNLYPLKIKTRHSPEFKTSLINFDDNDYNNATIKLNKVDPGISTGQYAVFYHYNQCIASSKMITHQMQRN